VRILIDLQGAQSGSRHRGIGRYSKSLAKAIIQNASHHDIRVLLNGLFDESIPHLINDFASILPADRFVVFSAPGPVEGLVAEHAWRKEAAELIRERFITELAPDVVLVLSLFEGAIDNALTSVRRLPTSVKTAVILYDLIPFLDPGKYIPAPPTSTWYYSKIESLRRADVLLAISDYSRMEAEVLGVDSKNVVAIYSAADESFSKDRVCAQSVSEVMMRVGINRKFIMHTSAFEPRKNFDGLIRAFGLIPKNIRKDYQLVLVVAIDLAGQISLRNIANEAGLADDELVYAGYVSDKDLIVLYSQCTLFVFPSFHEGFGLPILEAMCCGAAAIGSNLTSIPEVIGREDALFDPHSDKSIADLIERSLTDRIFWESLKAHSLIQSKKYSWDRSAKLAIDALEKLHIDASAEPSSLDTPQFFDKLASIGSPTESDLVACASSIFENDNAIRRAQAEHPTIRAIRTDNWSRQDRPHILLLKLDHIGDFIITLDAFATIRNAWPNARIDLVCGPWNKSLAEETRLFDKVFCCDVFAESGVDYDEDAMMGSGLAKYEALGLGRYDLAIDLRYYGDTRPLLLHTKAKYRVGYAVPGIKLDVALPEVPETQMVAQVGARGMALVATTLATFAPANGCAAEILLQGRSAVSLFKEGKVVGISPGTGNPIKSWGRERFREFVRLLNVMGGYKFVLIGGARDCAEANFIAESLPNADCLNLAGTKGIVDLPPIFVGFDLFIGNDTSTTHMAALLGVPTICVFAGQSHINSWRPLGRNVVTLKRMVECSPCYLTKLEKCTNNHLCVDIPPARVVAEAIALMSSARVSPNISHVVLLP
jgi:ADP-heptose:LPS heptosyltransferase/glycosyltransferase involved in cell wall biosynthesis